MKTKILAFILVLVMSLLMLAACGEKPDPTPTPTPGPGGNTDSDLLEHYDSIFWDETEIIIDLTENSNNNELSSTCRRWMAGDVSKTADEDLSFIDDLVSTRNEAAISVTRVNPQYSYKRTEGKSNGYGWGENIEDIATLGKSSSDSAPDIFCNFIYDIMSASLQGAFANLLDTNRSTNGQRANYLRFANAEFLANYVSEHGVAYTYVDPETGLSQAEIDGFMYQYMVSLTLSKFKMYCLSSNYYTDMVRAFLVTPVNTKMLNDIQVSDVEGAWNSDRTGDGEFNIADFFELVWDGGWNYNVLIDIANSGYYKKNADMEDLSETPNKNGNLNDKLIFAITTGSGLSASGMLYTSTVEVISRNWEEVYDETRTDENGNPLFLYEGYTYWYPGQRTVDTDDYNTFTQAQYEADMQKIEDLYSICGALTSLFENNQGIVAISNTECQNYANNDALDAIRKRFAADSVLFGGVICVGSLEDSVYGGMSQGFGVLPVPLYRDVDPDTGKPDPYQTQIHNVGRIGAISHGTKQFAQCTAYLDYLSVTSNDILTEYYDVELSMGVAETADNVAMLQYIRDNVRSSFDKAFEDAIGRYFMSDGEDEYGRDSNDRKWHALIKDNGYCFTAGDMKSAFDMYARQKQTALESLEQKYNDLP